MAISRRLKRASNNGSPTRHEVTSMCSTPLMVSEIAPADVLDADFMIGAAELDHPVGAECRPVAVQLAIDQLRALGRHRVDHRRGEGH
jgi:hypothetical protein